MSSIRMMIHDVCEFKLAALVERTHSDGTKYWVRDATVKTKDSTHDITLFSNNRLALLDGEHRFVPEAVAGSDQPESRLLS
jgi:hypothetical protein